MSKLEYKSVMANHLNGFIRLKRALGYKYTTAAYIVGEMDRFFDSIGLDKPVITKAVSDLWLERKPDEAASTYRGRIEVLVQFARYMSDMGLPCHIPAIPKVKARGFTAHIFSSEEIIRFFKACDAMILESLKKDSVIIMLPALFRLLYATGIRISEALRLKNDDVDMNHKVLRLRDTKNRKERLVPFTESLATVLRQYIYYRDRLPVKIDEEYFFLSLAGKACKNDGIIYMVPNNTVQCRNTAQRQASRSSCTRLPTYLQCSLSCEYGFYGNGYILLPPDSIKLPRPHIASSHEQLCKVM